MATYRRKERLQAFKIRSVAFTDAGCTLVSDEDGSTVSLDKTTTAMAAPFGGGYYITRDGARPTTMSAEAFESMYEQV